MDKRPDLIPINIVGAKVKSLQFEYEKDTVPVVNLSVSLVDDLDRSITSITLSTRSWYDYGAMKVTTKAYDLIGQLTKEMTKCAIVHMNSQRKVITQGDK